MKILHFNTYSSGGAAKASMRLHKGLLTAGFNSEMLILYPDVVNYPMVADFRKGLSYFQRYHRKLANWIINRQHGRLLDSLPRQTELFSFPVSAWDLTSHPSYEQADIIHLHWVAGFLDFTSFFVKCSKPIVWTLHDLEPFSGGFHYDFGVDKQAFKNLIDANLQVKFDALSIGKLEVICPSEFLRKTVMIQKASQDHEAHIFPNGLLKDEHNFIDQRLARKKLGLPANAKILLFLSDYLFYKRKGLDHFLEAIQLLDRNDVVTCLVGGLRGERISQRHDLIHRSRISDDSILNTYYAAADLYVNPSLADISSNTVMEAQAMGCPVVAYDTGGIPELEGPTSSILFSKEKNPAALAFAIERGLKRSPDRRLISNLAKEQYNLMHLIPKYQALYQRLSSNSKTTP